MKLRLFRKRAPRPVAAVRLRWSKLAEWSFWVLGFVLLGTYAYVYLDRAVYQAYEEWAFDRALSRRPAPVIGFLWHSLRTASPPAVERQSAEDAGSNLRMISRPRHAPAPASLPADDPELIGRMEIPRLGLHAMVRAGTAARTLRRALGHIEGTALPGEPGNIGIAGHRDTFFGGLRNLRKNDRIELDTLSGTHSYVVDSIAIVEPGDTAVLKSEAGRRELTLVTCFPFDYVGHAPRRYIVKARETTTLRPPPPPPSGPPGS